MFCIFLKSDSQWILSVWLYFPYSFMTQPLTTHRALVTGVRSLDLHSQSMRCCEGSRGLREGWACPWLQFEYLVGQRPETLFHPLIPIRVALQMARTTNPSISRHRRAFTHLPLKVGLPYDQVGASHFLCREIPAHTMYKLASKPQFHL